MSIDTQNPFSIRLSCLELAAEMYPDNQLIDIDQKMEKILLSATKFYNFVNGDLTCIPELADKVSIVPKDVSSGMSKTMIRINDINFEEKIIERVQKDPNRNIFYIDVDDVSPEDALEKLAKIKEQIDAAHEIKRLKVTAGLDETVDMHSLKDLSGSDDYTVLDEMEIAKMKHLAGNGVPLRKVFENANNERINVSSERIDEIRDGIMSFVDNPLEKMFEGVPTNTLEIDATPNSYNSIIKLVLRECVENAKSVVLVGNTQKLSEFVAQNAVNYRKNISNGSLMNMEFVNSGKLTIVDSLDNIELTGDEILVRQAKFSTQPLAGHKGRMIHLVDVGIGA